MDPVYHIINFSSKYGHFLDLLATSVTFVRGGTQLQHPIQHRLQNATLPLQRRLRMTTISPKMRVYISCNIEVCLKWCMHWPAVSKFKLFKAHRSTSSACRWTPSSTGFGISCLPLCFSPPEFSSSLYLAPLLWVNNVIVEGGFDPARTRRTCKDEPVALLCMHA